MRKKFLGKAFASINLYYLNVAAYQLWEGSVNDFNVHKHYEVYIRQTDDIQLTDKRQCYEAACKTLANILLGDFVISWNLPSGDVYEKMSIKN